MPYFCSLHSPRTRFWVIGVVAVTLGLGIVGSAIIGTAADDTSTQKPSAKQTLPKGTPAKQTPPRSPTSKKPPETISAESLKDFSKEDISILQGSLALLGYDQDGDDGDDGVVGPKTLAGMKQFAFDFNIKPSEISAKKLAEWIFDMSIISEVFPNWREIIVSQEFTQWSKEQPLAKQKIMAQIRKSVKPDDVIAILEAFTQAQQAKAPKPNPDAGAEELADQAEQTVIDQLTKLEDTITEHEQGRREEISQVLNAVPELYSQFAQSMREQAQHLQAFTGDEVACEKISDKDIPADILSLLPMLPDEEVVCVYKTMTINALSRERHDQKMAPQWARLLQQATLLQQFDQHKAQPLEWEGESCGCSSDLSRIVYGFYPFWMQEGKPQKIDFTVLSRIGYAALTFNEKGKIQENLHWAKTKPEADFLNTAHQYRTKMDLVIYNRDWSGWAEYTREEIEIIMDKLSANIVKKVTAPITGYAINALKPVMSLGLTPTPTMGDGVTLYLNFEDIPGRQLQETFSTLYFLITELRKKLDQTSPHYFLNVMFSAHHLLHQDSEYSLKNLITLKDDVNLFLVAMNGHEEVTLQQVRQQIIDLHLNSTVERTLIRKMVPVVFPIDQKKSEVQELVSYAEDNFGGLGLWPIPLVPEKGEDVMNQVLNETFLLSRDGAICQFVCPQRWPFRMIIDVLLGLLVVYGLLAVWIYDLRKWIDTYPWVFLGVVLFTITILVLTFWCDPFWKPWQTEMVLGVLVVVAVGTAWVMVKKKREGEYP